jgi:hypothetical protein
MAILHIKETVGSLSVTGHGLRKLFSPQEGNIPHAQSTCEQEDGKQELPEERFRGHRKHDTRCLF